eukprot:1137379-Pelagomonas_calceolata.AAC.2
MARKCRHHGVLDTVYGTCQASTTFAEGNTTGLQQKPPSRTHGVEAKGIGFVQTYLWNGKSDQLNGMEEVEGEHA